ncbi:rhodanese-like domain-containing protein [Halorhodospira neutriphila]|uniref:Rhodanese domain-containing protein n=1 Tax=Halorhodospira neutriphila TaxID=168379 RepID=A0ABS1E4X9_9GAMM|nr:rhodanese-like domain-containing protein [Halorhodospira neutriphila]MBK1726244.1 hypothetical protein [Halorhodospira neutriphila]
MSELLSWLQQNPGSAALWAALAALGAWLLWRRLTRRYQPLSPALAARRVNDGETLFLDVRTPGEVRGGTIPGAVHIPTPQIRQRWREIADATDRPVVVYCHSGLRGAFVAHTLTRHGFRQVYNLQGGIMAWRARDLPVAGGHD